MTYSVLRPFNRLTFILALLATSSFCFAQDAKDEAAKPTEDDPNIVELVEPLVDDRVMDVSARVGIKGVFLAAGADAALKMKVESGAAFAFQERRIVGTGEGAEALRSIRDYTGAEANTIVDTRKTNTKLNGSLARLVAQGQPGGIDFFSQTHHMTRADLDLLSMPGDTLPAIGLLPPGEIEKGDTWTPPLWAIQAVTGIEAMLTNDVKCQLKSFTKEQATVTFSGGVKGAVYGATSEIAINGSFAFNREQNLITQFVMTQSEKRSVGTVSPGMDIVATIKWDRKPVSTGRITDKQAEAVPLVPDTATSLLSFKTPWGVTFQHDRNWHVFHQTPELCILRLVESGGLIAQLNVTKVIDAQPGESTSDEQFQDDIRTALGDRLKKIQSAEIVNTGDGRRLYRVIADGAVAERSMKWLYCLCTAESGKQSAFVFTVGDEQMKKLSERDLDLVKTVGFGRVGKIARSPK